MAASLSNSKGLDHLRVKASTKGMALLKVKATAHPKVDHHRSSSKVRRNSSGVSSNNFHLSNNLANSSSVSSSIRHLANTNSKATLPLPHLATILVPQPKAMPLVTQTRFAQP